MFVEDDRVEHNRTCHPARLLHIGHAKIRRDLGNGTGTLALQLLQDGFCQVNTELEVFGCF